MRAQAPAQRARRGRMLRVHRVARDDGEDDDDNVVGRRATNGRVVYAFCVVMMVTATRNSGIIILFEVCWEQEGGSS